MKARTSDQTGDDPPHLPSEQEQARRFEKMRAARSQAMFEDYVELIDDLVRTTGEARPIDIARRLGVSHPTVVKAVGRLKREGLAVSRPYRGVFVTPEGAALAESVRARHRLVVDALVALGVPEDVAQQDAEGLEHHVSEITLKAFAAFLERSSPKPAMRPSSAKRPDRAADQGGSHPPVPARARADR